MKRIVIVGIVVALMHAPLAPALVGQQATASSPSAIDVSKLGPQVGDRVPDFALKDQTGKVRTLSSVMGPKGLMLVFYRSADWCPYCKTQLAELQSRSAPLAKSASGSPR